MGTYGASSGAIECSLGTWLHTIRFPLVGTAMAPIQAAVLAIASQGLGNRGRVVWISTIAAGLKSLSPSGRRLPLRNWKVCPPTRPQEFLKASRVWGGGGPRLGCCPTPYQGLTCHVNNRSKIRITFTSTENFTSKRSYIAFAREKKLHEVSRRAALAPTEVSVCTAPAEAAQVNH